MIGDEDRLEHAVEWGKVIMARLKRRREMQPVLARLEKALGFRRYRLLMFEVSTTGAMREMRRRLN